MKKMKILAIETTGKYGSAALIDEEGRIYSADTHDGFEHLRELISTIDNTLFIAGCRKENLTHVAASVGPGSFTGIRIGVTAARTLAQILDIPCISVSSLAGMARRVQKDAADQNHSVIAPIINARRHQVYAGAWLQNGGRMETILEERQYMIEELLQLLGSYTNVYFTGDGIDAYEDIIRGNMNENSFVFADEGIRYQHASSVACIALEKAEAGELLGYDELIPEYMRLAEAEQKLKDGTLSSKIKTMDF